MPYRAFVLDYDGTLASHGRVSAPVADAILSAKALGYRLILATGRVLEDVLSLYAGTKHFDRIVAENGAVLHNPSRNETTTLAPPPPREFVEQLQEAEVAPLSIGRVIVATLRPQENKIFPIVRAMDLDVQFSFNKRAVMVLPTGIDKASGTRVALAELDVAPRQVIAVGDGENDHSLLKLAGLKIALANAVPALQATADWVTDKPDGQGILEILARYANVRPQVEPHLS